MTEINGKNVQIVHDMFNEIGLDVGKTMEITVRRGDDIVKLTLTTTVDSSESGF